MVASHAFAVFLCLVYPMLPVSLDCQFCIASSVFSNVYLIPEVHMDMLGQGTCLYIFAIRFLFFLLFFFGWNNNFACSKRYNTNFIKYNKWRKIKIFSRHLIIPHCNTAKSIVIWNHFLVIKFEKCFADIVVRCQAFVSVSISYLPFYLRQSKHSSLILYCPHLTYDDLLLDFICVWAFINNLDFFPLLYVIQQITTLYIRILRYPLENLMSRTCWIFF